MDAVAWAAGFFDGEGCIHLQKTGTRGFAPRVSAPQKDIRPLKRLESLFGGHIYRRKVGQPGEIWVWNLNTREGISTMLTQIGPYLTTKLEQAAVEFLNQPWRGVKHGRAQPHPDIRWSDTLLASLLQNLKH